MTPNNLPEAPTPPLRAVLSGDARLAVEQAGSGPALVFLHGGLALRDQARAFTSCCADVATTVVYDARGRGDSSRHASVSLDEMADDLARVIEATCDGRAVVGGASMGAAVALVHALRAPETIRALVLVWPAYGPSGLAPDARRFVSEARDEARRRTLAGWSDASRATERHDEIARWADAFDDDGFTRACDALLDGRPMGSWDELSNIRVPVLVVTGPDDGLHPPALATRYAQAMGDATLAGGPDTVRPQDACVWIRAFLRQLG